MRRLVRLDFGVIDEVTLGGVLGGLVLLRLVT